MVVPSFPNEFPEEEIFRVFLLFSFLQTQIRVRDNSVRSNTKITDNETITARVALHSSSVEVMEQKADEMLSLKMI